MFPVLYSLTFLLFLASNTIGVEEGNLTRDELIKDIQKKVSDLWVNQMPQVGFRSDDQGNSYAICEVKPSMKLGTDEIMVTGHVLFKQNYPNGKLEVIIFLDGFPTEDNQTLRAIHIHDYGDLSEGCNSTGGHYNPFGVNHPKHPGDFGNFDTSSGKIRKRRGNLSATMFGTYSIIGRSVVVHKQIDDLGKGGNQASLDNGNAGKRLACCVIGFSKKNMWDKITPLLLEVKSDRQSRRALSGEGKIKAKKQGIV